MPFEQRGQIDQVRRDTVIVWPEQTQAKAIRLPCKGLTSQPVSCCMFERGILRESVCGVSRLSEPTVQQKKPGPLQQLTGIDELPELPLARRQTIQQRDSDDCVRRQRRMFQHGQRLREHPNGRANVPSPVLGLSAPDESTHSRQPAVTHRSVSLTRATLPVVQHETSDVRPGEAIDVPALAEYLRWHLADGQLPGLRLRDEIQVSQFPGGHSNLTYLVRAGGAELVLRRPPMGPVAHRAHDIAREFTWLSALHPVFPLAPCPYLLCEDPAVLGSVFSIMERRRGLIVRDQEPMPLAGHIETRRHLSEALVDTLAALHQVDITDDPIASLGRPIGFVDRQVRGWTDRWKKVRSESVPRLDATALWLQAHQPPDALDPAIVHGDFKLDNVILDPLNPSNIVAVLDWEMVALGDPLIDVGILLAYWVPLEESAFPDALSGVTGRPGYLTRDDMLDRYAQVSGRDISDIAFYEVFALFKIAVVIQQIHDRYLKGQTTDPRFAHLDTRVARLADRAFQLVTS